MATPAENLITTTTPDLTPAAQPEQAPAPPSEQPAATPDPPAHEPLASAVEADTAQPAAEEPKKEEPETQKEPEKQEAPAADTEPTHPEPTPAVTNPADEPASTEENMPPAPAKPSAPAHDDPEAKFVESGKDVRSAALGERSAEAGKKGELTTDGKSVCRAPPSQLRNIHSPLPTKETRQRS